MYYRPLILCSMLIAAECGRQYLQPQPGFIPVYIRPGDTPLEDINMDLAEAFRSYEYKHYKINSGRIIKEKSNFLEEEKSIPVIALYDVDYNQPEKFTNIQKITAKA